MKKELMLFFAILILGLVGIVYAETCVDECQKGNVCINDTNYKICGNYDSDSCLEWVVAIPCYDGFVCREGECVNLSQPNLCSDSDEGLDYYKLGSVSDCPTPSGGSGAGGCGIMDRCVNGTTLSENFCNYSYNHHTNREYAKILYDCPNGCKWGACINDSKKENNGTLVGNDRDSHGCIGSAGYSWCEEKQKCLRGWEENCSSLENQTLPGDGKIKILPEVASQRAKERLGELGFNITLKEVGQGNETKSSYEVSATKEGKMFGLFKVKGKVSADVDAETGEVMKVHKPWWSFLAGI